MRASPPTGTGYILLRGRQRFRLRLPRRRGSWLQGAAGLATRSPLEFQHGVCSRYFSFHEVKRRGAQTQVSVGLFVYVGGAADNVRNADQKKKKRKINSVRDKVFTTLCVYM